ncbi:PKD domain-containing protein [bacterium]|nr:PKD domain-containing protein [bacterium]
MRYRSRLSTYRGALRYAAVLVLTLLCQACGGSQEQADPTETGLLPRLPRPSSLLALVEAGPPQGYRRGTDYEPFLPNHNVSVPQLSMDVDPSADLTFSSSYDSQRRLGATAYAIYRFSEQAGASGPVELSAGWRQQPQAGTAWVALANYVTERWDWQRLPTDGSAIEIADQTPYVAPFGQSFAVVLLAGEQNQQLSWLLLGDAVAQAAAEASQQVLPEGLRVDVDASASVVYGAQSWLMDIDWDSDGIFELLDDSDGLAQYIYPAAAPGPVEATVRIHGGGASDSLQLAFNVPDGSQPVAQFSADVQQGSAPLSVSFDASASLPSSGASLSDYAWDMDGDGDFERSSGTSPYIEQVFGRHGTTQVGLRVTDSSAKSASASLEITLSSGWHRVVIDNNASLESSDPSLALIGPLARRRPAVAYHDALSGSLRYSIADDPEATNWGSPITVASGNTGYGPALAEVSGLPAIAYNAPNEFTPGAYLFYVRAQDTEGAQWDTPLELSQTDGGETVMFIADGKPAIYSITNKYSFAAYTYLVGYRALDSTGADWTDAEVPDYVEEEAYVFGLSSMLLDGKPALFYGFYADTPAELHRLRLTRAEQANAGTWLDPVVFGDATAGWSSIALCDGMPAAAYADNMLQGGVHFIRASTADGSAWENPAVQVDPRAGVGASCAMVLVNGKPLLSYYDSNTADLLAVFAEDNAGADWQSPMLVDGAGDMGRFSELTVSGSTPVVVYDDATGQRLLGAYYN